MWWGVESIFWVWNKLHKKLEDSFLKVNKTVRHVLAEKFLDRWTFQYSDPFFIHVIELHTIVLPIFYLAVPNRLQITDCESSYFHLILLMKFVSRLACFNTTRHFGQWVLSSSNFALSFFIVLSVCWIPHRWYEGEHHPDDFVYFARWYY